MTRTGNRATKEHRAAAEYLGSLDYAAALKRALPPLQLWTVRIYR